MSKPNILRPRIGASRSQVVKQPTVNSNIIKYEPSPVYNKYLPGKAAEVQLSNQTGSGNPGISHGHGHGLGHGHSHSHNHGGHLGQGHSTLGHGNTTTTTTYLSNLNEGGQLALAEGQDGQLGNLIRLTDMHAISIPSAGQKGLLTDPVVKTQASGG